MLCFCIENECQITVQLDDLIKFCHNLETSKETILEEIYKRLLQKEHASANSLNKETNQKCKKYIH